MVSSGRLCCGQLREEVVLWSVEGGGCVVVSWGRSLCCDQLREVVL